MLIEIDGNYFNPNSIAYLNKWIDSDKDCPDVGVEIHFNNGKMFVVCGATIDEIAEEINQKVKEWHQLIK